MSRYRSSLRAHGFVLLRGLISDAEAARYAAELSRVCGLRADRLAEADEDGQPEYYEHGGVARHAALWWLVVHPNVVAAVDELLDGPVKCLPGIDTIGMHASETEPHRDSSPAELPSLTADPFGEVCPLVRLILYPGSPGERFGCLPGSHRTAGRPADLVKASPDTWCWTELRAGDAVAFDPRLVHAGAPVTQPKPMTIVTYGLDGATAMETYFHARIKTARLGFPDPSPDLLAVLDRSGILLDGLTEPDAWAHYSTVWPPGP